MFALVAYSTPEAREEGRIHFNWYNGLIESVVSTGNENTPETAYVTISVAEERAVVVHLHMREICQTLVREPFLLNCVVAEDQKGTRHTIWFNPAAHFARLHKLVEDLHLNDGRWHA